MSNLDNIDRSQIKLKYGNNIVAIDSDYIYNSRFGSYAFDAITGTSNILFDYSTAIDEYGNKLVENMQYPSDIIPRQIVCDFMSAVNRYKLEDLSPDEVNHILEVNNSKIMYLNELSANNRLLHEIEKL